ncbi:hypothetical protein AJ79_09745 [Helicocarpus griseus UAMH5409]|uniref:Myb-like domain-containing protein n=1 Tax=Helicocarpus griseus UAMH5409 TaxID=1447875 RepID=A0A2B7WHQ4_9EURO|nr:hypothetical protein AJ79_09745 [Helicocarpus griseus UAMH5409]
MPHTDSKGVLKLSFADVFKSSKTIREEIAAASYKKAAVAARSKKAAAARNAKNGHHHAYPPNLPPGFPPLVYVPVQSNDGGVSQGPPQYQYQYQYQQQPPQPQEQASGSAPPQQQQQQQDHWTTDDDDTLRRLKAEDMSWKAISTSMNRPVHTLKMRWGIIKPMVEYKIQKPPPKEPPPKPQSECTHRKHERRVSFSEPLVTSGKSESSYTRTPKKKILYVDENFSLEEILLLNKLAAQYEEEKWLRISSRFYDKTGKRVTPQEAKEHVQRV